MSEESRWVREVWAPLRGTISYKPDTMLSVSFGTGAERLFFVISKDAPDANDPKEVIGITATKVIPTEDLPDPESLKHWIRRVLIDLETHGVDEWYRFGGVPFTDPHPELKHD